MTELEDFRQEKDAYFRRDPYSPIPAGERADFPGLRYFPEEPALRLTVPLERAEAPEEVEMQTSTGDVATYNTLGRVNFEVDGQPVTLTIYESEEGDLFLPFRDATSGHETYGAGRYLEPHRHDNDHLLLDFNLAYNPYCAYSPEWSCPVPPRENWLVAPIRAGELVYHEE